MNGKVLIANRGECACRIIRTCQSLGVKTVAVYTTDDELSLHIRLAEQTVLIKSYLNIEELVQQAINYGATAIHPGWGFQSENPEFERRCSEKGIIFIGPSSSNFSCLADKIEAKKLAYSIGIPAIPGSCVLLNLAEAVEKANYMGYPVVLKPVQGGGGIGIHTCFSEQDVKNSFQMAQIQVRKAFSDDRMYLEKFFTKCSRIGVQVFGDGNGQVVVFDEIKCSVQRRYQKVIEESPSPGIDEYERMRLYQMARSMAKSTSYKSAGSMEFLFDETTRTAYFMEFNTRLQVEHGVTELRFDIDLVEWMIRLAFGCLEEFVGECLDNWRKAPVGHAIQVRVCAEDPLKNFQPCPGVLSTVDIPKVLGTRIDSGVYEGFELNSNLDSMILKVLQLASNRSECIDSLIKVLRNSQITGPANIVDYIIQFLETSKFQSGDYTTDVLNSFNFLPTCIEVIKPDLLTTVQDWPGRIRQGLWRVGVPPSGAMDHLACRVANLLVGNAETDAVLEVFAIGLTLKFHCDSLVAITGIQTEVDVDGISKPQWQNFWIDKGSVLNLKPSYESTMGYRAYISIYGGIQVPEYLGSRSTFAVGKFGGHQGRVLQSGDILPIKKCVTEYVYRAIPKSLIPVYTNAWKIGCLPGPYEAPDYFKPEDISMFYSTKWKVHHDSNRLGIRLIGPAPQWARPDGGEEGSHPSNVHDYVYSIGSVSFTGDMPIIIGNDGPSLGGCVCPVTIIKAELWKIGQVRPGDTIQFVKMNIDDANRARKEQSLRINKMEETEVLIPESEMWYPKQTTAVLMKNSKSETHPGMTIRLSGDTCFIVEYGQMVLDLNLRFRIHFLEKVLLQINVNGVAETAPGVRSLQVKYDPDIIILHEILTLIMEIDGGLPDFASSDLTIDSRILHLPMSFNHSGVDVAIKRYMRTGRKEAPFLPSNIEFIVKNNGLSSVNELHDKIFAASYLCLGLGDAYLNSPCAVPINPLHRVVNPKYNPARTYTLEGSVGLGGAYMCLYTVEGTGGCQLVGRSLPIWNTYGTGSPLFSKDKPWLLEMFDQICFFPVEEEELEKMRLDFRNGKFIVKIEATEFSIRQYNEDLEKNHEHVAAYRQKQMIAAKKMNEEESISLAKLALKTNDSDEAKSLSSFDEEDFKLKNDPGRVYAHIPGMVGDILVKLQDTVNEGDTLLYLCAMEMENAVQCNVSGIVRSIHVSQGDMVGTGKLLVVIT